MPKYKYRINEVLETLPLKVYKKALRVIPSQLKVSNATFNNYRNILLDDTQDIPHEKIMQLEIILGVKRGELENFEVEAKPIVEHDDDDDSLVTKFGLSV